MNSKHSAGLASIPNDKWSVILLIFGSLMMLWWIFYPVIMQPNTQVLSHMSGDGIKNYFGLAHYVKHDDGLMLSGLNYPYSAFLPYTDNHPIYAMILGFINRNIYPIYPYTLGIINYWMMLGYVITSIIMYYLLRFFSLPRGYSVLIALVITFLSPQMDRISGHHSLSYAFYVPACWLLMLKMYHSVKIEWISGLLLMLIMLISGWSHPYYVPLIGFFGTALYVYQLFGRNRKRYPIIFILMGMFIPYFSLKLLDPYSDRTTFPWGLDVYTTYVESVLLPYRGKLYAAINGLIDLRDAPFEGLAYIGILGIPVLIAAMYLIIKRLLSNRTDRLMTTHTLLNLSCLAGLSIWFLGTGWVHAILPKEADQVLTPLYQFRSLGRFAWTFYYPFTVLVAYFMYRFYRKLRSTKINNWAYAVLFIGCAIWVNDVYNHVQGAKNSSRLNTLLLNNDSSFVDLLTKYGYNVSDFQAILSVPHYIKGSDKMDSFADDQSLRQAYKAAYSSGIPIMSMHLARPSIHHTIALRQLFSKPWISKLIRKDLDDRPILVMKKGPLKKPYEAEFMKNTQSLVETPEYELYILPISYFDVRHDPFYEMFPNSRVLTTTLTDNQILTSPADQPIIYYNFDDQDLSIGLINHAKRLDAASQEAIILDVSPFPDSIRAADMELSLWSYIDHESRHNPGLIFSQWNGDEMISTTREIYPDKAYNIINRWGRTSYVFTLSPACTEVRIQTWHQDCFIDELLLRSIDTQVITKRNDVISINNFPLIETE